GAPRFSPDGKKLAYRAQRRTGFEADKWELMIVAVEKDGTFKDSPRPLTAKLDRSVDGLAWETSDALLVQVESEARTTLLRAIPAQATVAPAGFKVEATIGSLSVSRNGKTIAYTVASLLSPPEVAINGLRGEPRVVSKVNATLFEEMSCGTTQPENVKVPVEGAQMQMWILKPPGFDPKKKWPVAYLVHGG